jgi:hypothetical protein
MPNNREAIERLRDALAFADEFALGDGAALNATPHELTVGDARALLSALSDMGVSEAYAELRRRADELGYPCVNEALDALAEMQAARLTGSAK